MGSYNKREYKEGFLLDFIHVLFGLDIIKTIALSGLLTGPVLPAAASINSTCFHKKI